MAVDEKKSMVERKEESLPNDSLENSATNPMEKKGDVHPIEEHKIIKASVLLITPREIILDLGGKADGVMPISEVRELKNLKVGDPIEVYVMEREDKWGEVSISYKMAKLIKTWDQIEQAYKNQEAIQVVVERKIKGGVVASFQGVNLFLPGSQIDLSPVKDFDGEIGKTYQVRVINFNRVKANGILSRRVLLQKEQEAQRKEVIAGLKEGQILEGTVKNVTDFGAFIDLGGGIVGLVHKNDVNWGKKLKSVTQAKNEKGEPFFPVGKPIKVVVKDFDIEAGNIYLSTKLLIDNPWNLFAEKVKEGDTIKGKVKEIADYGAFVEISAYPGVTGLAHVSELSHASYLDHPSEVVAVGDEKEFMVLSVKKDEHDLRLGIKQLSPNPWDVPEIIGKYAIGSIHKAKVGALMHSGAYLSLEQGVEGFVHNKSLSWTKKIFNPSEVLKKKEMIDVKILDIDYEHKTMLLGVREVSDNPWESFKETFSIGSTHKGTILRKVNGGSVVELPYGITTFVSNRDLVKSDKSETKEKDDMDFVVIAFSDQPGKEGILVSHTETYKKSQKKPGAPKRTRSSNSKPLNFVSNEKQSTLGDFAELSKLRDELLKKAKEEEKNIPSKKK